MVQGWRLMNVQGEKPAETGLLTHSGGGILGLNTIERAWSKVGRAVFHDDYCQGEVTTVKRSREYESQDVSGSVHVRFSSHPRPVPSSWDHELGGQITTSTFLLILGQICINHTPFRTSCEKGEMSRKRRKRKQKWERWMRKEEHRRHRKRHRLCQTTMGLTEMKKRVATYGRGKIYLQWQQREMYQQ